MRVGILVVLGAAVVGGCGPIAEESPDGSLASELTQSAVTDVSRSPSVRSSLNYNFGKSIAVDAYGTVHAVWLVGGTAGTITYSRSTDNGVTWLPTPVPLAPRAMSAAGEPKIAAGPTTGRNLWVVWHGSYASDGIPHVFLQRSTDGGVTWTMSVVSDRADVGMAWPSVAAWDQTVAVTWADGRTRSAEVYVRASADSGVTFPNPAVAVSVPDGKSSWTPSVAVSAGIVHVAWTDERHDNVDCALEGGGITCEEEEYYRRSTDGGLTFTEPEIRLTTDPGAPFSSYAPSIVAWGPSVHVVYFDHRTGSWKVYYRRSVNGGGSFEPGEQLLSSASEIVPSARPSIAAFADELHVTWWRESTDGTADVLYTSNLFRGDAASWSPVVNITTDVAGRSVHPSIAISPNRNAFVLWYDDRPGLEVVYARRLAP